MGRFSKALRSEVEQHEAKLQEKLGNLNKEELVEWCKKEFQAHYAVIFATMKTIAPARIIEMTGLDRHKASTIALARHDRLWFDALQAALARRRLADGQIPDTYRGYFRRVVFGREMRISGRGKASEAVRNYVICHCIQSIVKYTQYKATRNEVSFDADCASTIVSQALGGKPNSATVQRIWIERPAQFGKKRET